MKKAENPTEGAPLILTLTLDKSSQKYFNRLRAVYFPADRNYLDAHLTLFHKLPGSEIDTIQQQLADISQEQSNLSLEVKQLRMMGRGVAFSLESDLLLKLHNRLSQLWKPWLSPQDQQTLWPHITIQNKVEVAKAKALYQKLGHNFSPFIAEGLGLSLWTYQQGPWQWLNDFPFTG